MSKSSLSQSQPVFPGYDLVPFKQAPVSKNIQKSLYLLGTTIDNLFRRHPLTYVAFATLTFPTPVKSPCEAHRHLNSFLNAIRKRGLPYIWVLEPHQKEGLHYHLLVVLPFNCHAGTQVERWADTIHDDQKRELMNPELRAEYDWWTATAPRYGFGRIDVAPIYSNAEAIRKYLTKTTWRHDHWVFDEVKRLRFWKCSRNLRSGRTNFTWNTPGSKASRDRMAAWAASQGCESMEALKALHGSRWGFKFLCATTILTAPSAVPQSYLLVPSHNEFIGESAPAGESPSRWQAAGRVTADEGFEGTGRGEAKPRPPKNPVCMPVPAEPSLRSRRSDDHAAPSPFRVPNQRKYQP